MPKPTLRQSRPASPPPGWPDPRNSLEVMVPPRPTSKNYSSDARRVQCVTLIATMLPAQPGGEEPVLS